MSNRPKDSSGDAGTSNGIEMPEQGHGGAARGNPIVPSVLVDESNGVLRPADFNLGDPELVEKLKEKFNETLSSIELVGNDRRSLVEDPKAGRLARGMEARNVRVVTQRNQHYTRTEMVIAADGAKQRHEPLSEINKRLFMSVTSYIGPVDRSFYGSPEAKIFVVNVPAGKYGQASINDVPMLLAPGAHVIEGSLLLGQQDVAEVLLAEIDTSSGDPLNRRQPTINRGMFVDSGELNVSHGTAHALMIPPGEFALVTVDNKRSILWGQEAPYFIRSKTQFEVQSNRSYKPATTRYVSHGTLHFFNIPVGQIAAIRVNGEAHLVQGNGQPFVLGEYGEQVQFDSTTGFHRNTEKLIRFGDKLYHNIPATEVLACQKDGQVMFLEAKDNKANQVGGFLAFSKDGGVSFVEARKDGGSAVTESLPLRFTLPVVGKSVANFLWKREDGDGYGFYPATSQRISIGLHDRVYVEPNRALVTQNDGGSPKVVSVGESRTKVCRPDEQVVGIVDLRLKQLRMPTREKIQAHQADGRSKPGSFSYMMQGGTKVALKIVASFTVEDAVKYLGLAGDINQITTFIENTIASDLTSFMAKRPYGGIFHHSGTAINLPPARESAAETSEPEPHGGAEAGSSHSHKGAEKSDEQGALNVEAQHYIEEKLASFGIKLHSIQFEDFAPYNAEVRKDLEKSAEQALLQRARLNQLRAQQAADQQEQAMQQQLKLSAIANQGAVITAEQALVTQQQALADAKRKLAETEAQTTGFEQLGSLVAMVQLAKSNPEQAPMILEMAKMQIAAKAAQGATFTGMSASATTQLSALSQGLQTGSFNIFSQLGSQGGVIRDQALQAPGQASDHAN